jgi:hypothetical protein
MAAMISNMRRRSRLIMFILAISFVVGFLLLSLGGITDTIRTWTNREPTGPRRPDELGQVGEKSITQAEYEKQKRYYSDLYQLNTNARSIPDHIQEQIAQQTWSYLVSEKAMEKVYKQEKIVLLPDEVVEILKMAPPREVIEDTAFYTDGKFDPKKYERVLYTQLFLFQHYTPYHDYIRQTRLDADLKASFRVPSKQGPYDQAREQTRFSITYLELVPNNFVKNPDDKQIWSYYNHHKADFPKPERRVMRYAVFPLKVGPEDSASARAQIVETYSSIRIPDDFDSQTDRANDSIGFWFQSDSLDSTVRGAVANLPKDSMTEPVLTRDGWQIIKLTDRNKDSVRLRVITVPIEVTASTMSAINEEVGNLTERSKTENFDTVAKELGVEVRDAPPLEKGKTYEFDPEISASVELFAKRAKLGDVSTPYRTSRGEIYVFHLSAIQKGLASVMDSFEIRNKVSSKLTTSQAKPMMESRAQKILREIKAGKSLEDIAQGDSLIKRQNRQQTTIAGFSYIGPEFAGTVYGLKTGQTSGLVQTERGMYFIRCDSREDVNPPPNAYWAQSKVNTALGKVREALQKPPRVVDWRNPFSF